MSLRMDLHCHSTMSDGTCAPAAIVRMAAKAGIEILALTDHDTMAGVSEAMQTAEEQDMRLLPSVELDTESPFELHMLGLDVDPCSPNLQQALEDIQIRRRRRNARILDKLRDAGYDVASYLHESEGNTTRLHIAMALHEAGYAKSVTDAFRGFLSPGMPGYYAELRLTPVQAIDLIKKAGGISVLAHPCHIRSNPHQLVAELAEAGLMGLEAYYPASTLGQTETFLSLARQFGLLVTCGSDFHGRNREGNPLGCAWRDVACLNETAELFLSRPRREICH